MRLRSIGDRICLVETPFKKGTGFLIAADHVITNYHVVEELILNPSLAKEVICSFDYRQTDDGAAPTNIKQFGLRANGVLANSPYDKTDLTGVENQISTSSITRCWGSPRWSAIYLGAKTRFGDGSIL